MYTKTNQILAFLAENPNSTVKEIGVSLVTVKSLTQSENPFVQEVRHARRHPATTESASNGRGRPMNEYKLTKRGKDKARTLAKQAARKAAQEPVAV